MRGEQFSKITESVQLIGSPPRARGAATRHATVRHWRGITPACAGSSRGFRSPRKSRRDHPRVRGEQWRAMEDRGSLPGSPPRARGAESAWSDAEPFGGITPACAGSRSRRKATFRISTDHPRVRGEQTSSQSLSTGCDGSPPRARGAEGEGPRHDVRPGITPVCAGSSLPAGRPRRPARDHPRVRGEQTTRPGQFLPRAGSPPRARGAGAEAHRDPAGLGITPACAGSRSSFPR